MIDIEPFAPVHVEGVRGAPLDRYAGIFNDSFLAAVARDGNRTWTCLEAGRPVFVGGLVPRGDGLAGWGIFTEYARHHHVLAVHRLVRDVIAAGGRIEIDLDPGFRQSTRWAEMLGFQWSQN